MRNTHKLLIAAAVGVIALVTLAGTAKADPINITLNAQYFTVTASGSGDFETQCCSTDLSMVNSTLGSDGLPVYSGNSTFTLQDLNSSGEIEWWTPGTTAGGDKVTASGTGTITTPFSSTSMFPPTGSNGNGGGDGSGFLTAEFTGTFSLAEDSMVTFTLGSDDDSFFFVDGNLVTSLGGVHGDSPAPTNTVTLSAGSHQIELFFADRQTTQAALDFSLDSTGIVPTPEPASLGLLGLGLACFAFVARKRLLRQN